MAEPITKPVIAKAVDRAVRASAHLPPAEAAAQAKSLVLSEPVIAKATTPIRWYKSQAILGNITAVLGALLIVAPDAAPVLVPEHADLIVKWVGAVTAFVGAYNGIKGRVTTTRPIG